MRPNGERTTMDSELADFRRYLAKVTTHVRQIEKRRGSRINIDEDTVTHYWAWGADVRWAAEQLEYDQLGMVDIFGNVTR